MALSLEDPNKSVPETTVAGMDEFRMAALPFLGTEAIADGILTRGRLRWNFDPLHPDVYLAKGARRNLAVRTEAAWLWTRRQAIVAGRAAAAQYGGRVDDSAPVELLTVARRSQPGVITRGDRIADDEVRLRGSMRVTTPARTALDLARYLPRRTAVVHLDALSAATTVSTDDVWPLDHRYRGARGIARAREALVYMDRGSRSPEESRLRLLLIDGGLHGPETDIIVSSELGWARVAMGWRRQRVGVAYAAQPALDTASAELLQLEGWVTITVLPEHHRSQILYRVRRALRRRTPNMLAN